MARIEGAGVVLERPEGGYIAADAATEYKNLKTATGILLALVAASICTTTVPGLTVAAFNGMIEDTVEATIDSLPEEVQPAAWDAWITLDRSLI